MPVYVLGFGGNLDQPELHLHTALQQLTKSPEITLIKNSSLYQSPALLHKDNPEPQPHFINMVAVIHANCHPESLLRFIHYIEASHGRAREKIWQARPLDIDILLCDNDHFSSNRLTIPHSQMHHRDFVTFPLLEIIDYIPHSMRPLCPQPTTKNIRQSTCTRITQRYK